MANKSPFELIIELDKLHPQFQILRDAPGFSPARQMFEDVFSTYKDLDGNFLEQLQSSGFDARVFELYLHAYFSRSGFKIDRSHQSPDFLVCKRGMTVAVEATTVNAAQSGVLAAEGKSVRSLSDKERAEYGRNELPIRFGSPLLSKLRERYWDLPQCKSLPFVIAIQAFQDQGSLEFSDSSLASYLYGIEHDASWDHKGNLVVQERTIDKHALGTKTISSNFFSQPETEHISAILFTNCGTTAKFSRMGYQSGYGNERVTIKRMGYCYNPDKDAMDPTFFSYDLDCPPMVESWGQGLVLLHNPNCRVPVPKGFFGPIVQGYYKSGRYLPEYGEWHPFMSQTLSTYVNNLKQITPPQIVAQGPINIKAIPRSLFWAHVETRFDLDGKDEHGWFSDESGAFLGLLAQNRGDDAWSYWVYGKDEYSEYYCIDTNVVEDLRGVARRTLQESMFRYTKKPQRMFPRPKE